MNTSYYSKSATNPDAISIAARAPNWFRGKEYKALAPKYWFFKKYKDDGDEEFYTEQYKKEVLGPLDPKQVYQDLGKDAVMLCWEAPKKFCHRHIVAEWLQEELGITITEL